jgi:hypothetical protein
MCSSVLQRDTVFPQPSVSLLCNSYEKRMVTSLPTTQSTDHLSTPELDPNLTQQLQISPPQLP